MPSTTGVKTQPVPAAQESLVHSLPSSQTGAAPPVQTPAWQVSKLVQASPSVHAVPSPFSGFEHAPLPESQTPAS